MKPALRRFTSLVLCLFILLSAIPLGIAAETPAAEPTEKPVYTSLPKPKGTLRSPGTEKWKIPTVVPKGINPYPVCPHPYNNDMNAYYAYSEPDAIGYVVTFSADSVLEAGFDYVAIFDKDRNQMSFLDSSNVLWYQFTGTQLAGLELVINSSKFYTNLYTDASGTANGFRYTKIIPVYPENNTTATLFTCEQSGPNAATLVWNKVTGAQGYTLYRGTGGAYTAVTDIVGSVTATDNGLAAGITYYYAIGPYYVDGAMVRHYYSYSNEMSVSIMAAPVFEKAVALNDTTAYLKWKSNSEVDGYTISRAIGNPAGPYVYLKLVEGTSYVDKTLISGNTYFYKVTPYIMYSQRIKGAESVASPAVTYTAPSLVSVRQHNSNTMKIIWNAVAGVNGYQVYRKTGPTGTYSNIKTVTGSVNYLDVGLTPGLKYYYTVRPYTIISGVTYYGAFTAVLSETILARAALTLVHRLSATKVHFKWLSFTPAQNADGYRIYRSTSSTGTFTYCKTFLDTGAAEENLYFTDPTMVAGKTYYYKIAAFRLYGATRVDGALSAAKKLQ